MLEPLFGCKNKIGMTLLKKAEEKIDGISPYQLEFSANIIIDDDSAKSNVTFFGPLFELQEELAEMVEDKIHHDQAMRIAELIIRYVFFTKDRFGYRGKIPPIPSSSEEIELYTFCRQYNYGNPILVEMERNAKDEEHIRDLCANSLVKNFDKMVEKYNLKDFVKSVEEARQNPFIAIMPFITDPEDSKNYNDDLVCYHTPSSSKKNKAP